MAKMMFYSGREGVIIGLKDNRKWFVDVGFINEQTYKEAVSNGFDIKEWKDKNKQKVFVGEKNNQREI